MVTAVCQTTTIAAVQLSGSSFCSAFAETDVAAEVSSAADAAMIAAATAVSGSSYCFSSAVTAAEFSAVTDADAIITADVQPHGITAVETIVAANLFENSIGGIFGCPSCHGSNPSLIEYLKLFLPFFPLHIRNFIQMYLKITEFMHTFELIQNMMNHMDEYQALFKMFENSDHAQSSNIFQTAASFMQGTPTNMPDFDSIQKMMEGSDLIDEFTYVEESSGAGRNGS